MKLTLFLILAGLLQVSATVYSQNTRFTLDMRGKQVAEVLKQIEQESDFRFFYQREQVDVTRTVDLKVTGKTVEEILDQLFEGEGITYKVLEDNLVLLRPEKTQYQENAPAQQQKSVTGKVTNTSGDPLPGVTVVVKGTTTGTITNADGTFVISNVPPEGSLVFSFVGMKGQEVVIGGKTTINVTLAEETVGIEEVVAVGYGTQKKINITGSVASMSGDEIAKKPVTQTSMALQGMASGVTVTQSSGEPGQDGGTIRIRGIGTLGDSNPLVLVDGIAASINSVDPNDIENISILKDAASASIYGSRAANGVIIITTKRAQKNQFSINYNNYVGWQEATNLPQIVSGYDHMVLMNEANRNVSKPEPFKQDYIDNYAKYAPSDDYPETNWHKEMLKDKALQQNHHLSINGGGEKVSMIASVSYLNQDGITINTNFKRVNLRLNTDVKLKENLQFGFDILLRETDDANPASGTPWYFLNRYPRNLIGMNSNGSWGIGWDGANSWANETDGGMRHNKDYTATANLNLNWQPISGLNLNLQYAPERNFNHTKSFAKHVNLYYPNGDLYNPNQYKAQLTERYSKNMANNLRAMATYNKSFGQSNWSAIVGFEQMSYRSDWMQGFRNEFLLENYEVLDAGSPTNQQATGSASESSLRSIFGRINYNFNQKYLVEANLRYDGSSRFAEGNQYGVFPSFSAGWRITEEEFLKNASWLDNLKLRASWGQLGNQNIGNYPSSSVVTLGQDYVFNNGVAAQGGAILESANQNISWETTEMTNLGIDVSLFSKLSFSLEYFIKNTNDILLKLPIPMTTGLNPAYQNAGKVRNSGWDLSGNFNDKKGAFEYQIGFNISDVKNEIIDLVGTGPYISSRTIQKEGYSIYSLYGLQSDGLFQSPEEIISHAKQYGTNLKPGDIKYVDQLTVDSDGDGTFDQADGVINAQDRVIMGSYMPRYTFGLDIYGKYKDFDISALFQGVGKVDGFLDGQGVFAFYVGASAREWQKDYWRQDNLDASYPRLTFGYPNNEQVSTFWMKSASYLRLKNIQLGYSVPKRLLNKTFVNSCRIFFSGQNIFTLDNFYDGFDPEAPIGTGDYYPIVRVFSFGVDIKF